MRDNCGVVATEFSDFAKELGLEVYKDMGWFVVDNPTLNKQDFIKAELEQMQEEGLDPDSEEDRTEFANKHSLLNELQKVPHVWNVYDGQIIDFSGKHQFVETGMAADLDKGRYISGKIVRV